VKLGIERAEVKVEAWNTYTATTLKRINTSCVLIFKPPLDREIFGLVRVYTESCGVLWDAVLEHNIYLGEVPAGAKIELESVQARIIHRKRLRLQLKIGRR
jgi:hypothetical protein